MDRDLDVVPFWRALAVVNHRPSRLALALGLLLAAAPIAAQQDAAPSVPIAGRVLAADTGVALRRARIEVTPGRTVEPLFTDDDGRFAFALARGESFVVTATKAGYASTSVRATAKASVELRVLMTRGAAVSGRVLDSNGAPEVAASVVATRLDAEAGGPARASFTTTTDDLGDYRLAGLPAGRYAIGARWSPGSLSLPVRLPEPLESLSFGTPRFDPIGARDIVIPPLPQTVREVVLQAGDDGRVAAMVLPPQPTASSMRAEALARLKLQSESAGADDLYCPGEGVLRGRVLTAQGGPLAGAAVRITITNQPVALVSEWTNRAGEYSVGCLLPGGYTVEIARLGHVLPGGGTTYQGSATVKEDEPVAALPDVVFERASVATGTIVDEHGEPLEGAVVRALQVRYVRGRATAVAVGVERRSDDRGAFRLYGLGPGQYLVKASAGASLYAENRGRATGYTPLFYPGTPSIEAAVQARVEPGADLPGLDIVFRPALAARITGTAIDESGAPAAGTVILSASHRSGAVATDPVVLPIGPEGAFAIPDVPSGEYVVHAVVPPGPGRTAEFGSEYVTVIDRDPEPLLIRTSTGGTLEGRLVIDEALAIDGAPSAVRGDFMLLAYPIDPDRTPFSGRAAGLVTQSDGTFYAVGLYGPRRFTLLQASPGWYLKSVTIAGTDVTDTGFELPGSGTATGAEIVLSARGASIAGRVVDGRNRPAAAGVVVMPSDRRLWMPYARQLKRVETRDGTFHVQGLPPGDYWVAAVPSFTGSGTDEWQNPAVLDALASRAERVTVGESEAVEVPLLRLP